MIDPFIDADVFKARVGGGQRGMVGAPVPRKAKAGVDHASNRLILQSKSDAARAGHKAASARMMPPVRHGGFSCGHCGHADWRLHKVATSEGVHHATLAFKGCARCGTMHTTRLDAHKQTIGDALFDLRKLTTD